MMNQLGILLTNTGTPDAPTASGVRKYLKIFLSDPRVVHLPRLIWLPILYCLILPFRSKKSARLYQKIWQRDGSPMTVHMSKIVEKLRVLLPHAHIEVGMNYGNPSIQHALKKMQASEINKLIVLPLYPQYSHTTTASTFDHVNKALKKLRFSPALTGIKNYAAHPDYIQALATSVTAYWRTHGRGEHLLISFHGLPKRFIEAGDPYQTECEATTALLASALNLRPADFTLCYQSQFGYDKWLQPSTQGLLMSLPEKGVRNVDIVCPGFSVDCLETLEEIVITGAESFRSAGGVELRYIPALNDADLHLEMIRRVLMP